MQKGNDAQKDLRTVFVRSISFDATEKDIEEAFSNIGPVKSCFLVRVKGQEKHKGFGFVQFSLPEDAERAATELNGQALAGRKLQVELANKRASLEERNKKRKLGTEQGAAASETAGDGATPAPNASEPAAAAAAPQQQRPAKRPKPGPQPGRAATGASAAAAAAAAEKHKLLRAVAVGNLVPQALTEAMALARAAGPVDEIMNPAPADVLQQAKLEADGCSGLVIIVIYKTVKDAMLAVSKLHNQKVALGQGQGQAGKKGKKGAKRKGRQDGDGEGDGEAAEAAEAGAAQQQHITLWAREVKGEGAHVKQWRVILRNLPFKVTEEQLLKALQVAGFVWELKVPRGPDGRPKGFAFAAFTCRAHAEKAISALNGKELAGRTVVVDWAVAKSQYDAMQKQQAPEDDGKAKKGPEEGDDAGGSDADGEPGSASDGGGSEGEDDDADEDEDEGDEEGDEEGEDGEGEDESLDFQDGDEGEEDGSDGGEGEEGEEEAEHGMLHGVLARVLQEQDGSEAGGKEEEGKAAGQKQQQQQGKQQGKQQQHAAGKPAAKPLWQGDEAHDPEAEDEAADRSRPGSTSKPGAGVDSTVFVRGLPLDVLQPQLQARMEVFGPVKSCRVVMDKASAKPKGTAFVEFKDAESAKKAADACARGRRHEGPGITMSGRQLDVDLALSQDSARSLAAARASGKAAPRDKRNMYLAKEGAITEGSPAWAGMSAHDQAKRKRAAEERNTKLRSPNFVFSRTRLSVRNIPPDWTEAQLRGMFLRAVRQRATKENPRVLQCKILREEGRYEESGRRRSKGLGFVEFESHDHALAAMRQLNNNPDTPWGKDKRPILEFAIENVKVLKKIEMFKAKAEMKKKHAAGQAAAADGTDNGAAPAANGEAEAGEGRKQGKGMADGEKKKRQAKGAERAAAAHGDGEGEGGTGLSQRQKKRLKQRERQETKRQLLKEGGTKALVEAVEAKRQARGQQPLQQQQQQAGKQRPERGGGRQQGQQERERGRGRERPTQQVEEAASRARKRQADRELDQIAEEALVGSRPEGSGKRRKHTDVEGGDKLDRLVERYKAKLEGGSGAKARRQQQQQADKAGKAKAASAASAAPSPGLVAAVSGAASGMKRWFE